MLLPLQLNNLLGPIQPASSAGVSSVSSSSASSPSSSSESSLACCPVISVEVTLLPLGGTGCGIEVTNGVAYSIGTQIINLMYSDPCHSISVILLNGVVPPAIVPDGSPIGLQVIPTISYTNCGAMGPNCIRHISSASPTPPMMMMFKRRKRYLVGRAIKKKIKIVRG